MTEWTVLVTGCGAPGFPGTAYSLRNNPHDQPVRIVGIDVREAQAGRYLTDEFYTVPRAESEDFVQDVLAICRQEDVDVVLPQVTRELPVLASQREAVENQGTTVAISSERAIDRANDKGTLASVADEADVPTPDTSRVETADELSEAATRLGYPDRPVVVKPPVANGSRGLRILDANRDRQRAFYREKPDGRTTTLAALQKILGDSFPELLVVEYLPGTEYTVDAYRAPGGETEVLPRRRDEVKAGISFAATPVDDDDMRAWTRRLGEELGLCYAFGFQFREDEDGRPRLLECNPRVQGTSVASTLAGGNTVYGAVAAAMGETIPEFDPEWGARFHRYWGGVGVVDGSFRGDVGGQR